MIPVDQTRFDAKQKPFGNCFASCVASILEMPLDDVLDDSMIDDGSHWWLSWQWWLEKLGYGLVHLQGSPPGWFFPIKGYSIMSGKSPRGNFDHSVVALDGKMVHDPHPSRAGIEGEPTCWVLLYPIELPRRA